MGLLSQIPLIAFILAYELPSPTDSPLGASPALGILVLLGSGLVCAAAIQLFKIWSPARFDLLGVSPVGISVRTVDTCRVVPWSHAAVVGTRLVIAPSRYGWTRAFGLTEAQARRARSLRPAGVSADSLAMDRPYRRRNALRALA